MDVGKVIGKTFMSFVGKDGRPVEIYKFFCNYNAPVTDPLFEGEQCASFSVQRASLDLWRQAGMFVPEVGDSCIIRYNKYGKLDHFDEVIT